VVTTPQDVSNHSGQRSAGQGTSSTVANMHNICLFSLRGLPKQPVRQASGGAEQPGSTEVPDDEHDSIASRAGYPKTSGVRGSGYRPEEAETTTPTALQVHTR